MSWNVRLGERYNASVRKVLVAVPREGTDNGIECKGEKVL